MYRYRQVVIVQARHDRRYREERLEFETRYSHQVTFADDKRAEIEIRIEEVDVFSDGRLIGTIGRIPDDLARISATVWRDGEVSFNRDVFIVGDSYAGFEMISTRHYNGYVMDDYRREHGYLAGRLDLQYGEVRPINHSRLFDPYSSRGYVPVSLLPDEDGWIWDYGTDAISAAADDYGFYYGYDKSAGGAGSAYRSEPLNLDREYEYNTWNGTNIRMKRESQLQRIK